ncbi:alpha/beta fold hydrolase [Thiohalobacter sp. IOR34]|uniref:alpha/beta hydrolase n=1 Tax=Thiohalobacter sp. IOR34 TaxID=3057176 RepID=UPI0025B00531|nr:alpha/beta fold hydrolase [Thiohalobacter sp. IOR34]WJW76506.1 alpha/beta fold hydrolase [Thiohalobacter sp. IOR34]
MKRLTTLLAGLSFFLLSLPGIAAEEVKQEYQGLTLNARLQLAAGHSLQDGVVLLVHGTLAHNGMEIITTLQDLLAENGRNSLAINLSLALDDRHGFYDCTVPHRHRHTDALDEIAAWLAWLKRQGVGDVVLMGHSRGGNQTAWFVAERDDPLIRKLILIAPQTWSRDYAAESYQARFGVPLAPVLETARARVAAGQGGELMGPIGFIYCKDARATPAAVLSYYSDDPRMDTPYLLPRIDKPVLVFAGSEDQVVKGLDKRLAPLAEQGVIRLVVLEGADHGFRDLYADELVEAAVAFIGKP